MKKHSRSAVLGSHSRNKSSRENPEGISISKKSKARNAASPSPPKKGVGARIGQASPDKSPGKRKAFACGGDSSSYLESLSQISSIMPPDDSSLMSTLPHSPAKRRRDPDSTMERAVQMARGQPDGADKSIHKSPKAKKSADRSLRKSPKVKKAAAPTLNNIEEEEEGAVRGQSDQENSTVLVQKTKCLKVPLKQAGKKLKSLKGSGGKKAATKATKSFDAALANESVVQKKPQLTWKEKRKERKMARNNSTLIFAVKALWEDLRRQDLPDEKRQALCQKLYQKVQGKVKELCMVHDSARVIECVIKYGGVELRSSILEEVKDSISLLAKTKYAKHVIRKLLKYGNKAQSGAVMKGFQGSVRKLIRHREAAELVDYAYNELATAPQRLFLLEEFYGPAFAMFKSQSTQCLDDVLAEQPDKIDMIMRNLKETLLPLIDKQILTLPMVHKIFHDFFKYATGSLKKDVIEALRESLIHLLHTKDGTKVAMSCFWDGSAKDRKLMMKKCLKEHVVKVCTEEAGHLLLLAVFDSVDDTVLVQKVILDEMLRHVGELVQNPHGRKVLMYLLKPRDQHFFCPDVTQLLQQGDTNTTSKKSGEVRAGQLRDYVSGPLLSYLTDNALQLLSDSHTSLLIPLILTHASGDPSAAMAALAEAVVSSSDPGTGAGAGGKGTNLVEDPAAHITLKKILAADKHAMLQGKDALFCVALLNAADAGTYKAWIASNRGCFMLVSLMEVENAQVSESLQQHLAPLKKYLHKMTFKGAEILLRKLDAQMDRQAQKMEISL